MNFIGISLELLKLQALKVKKVIFPKKKIRPNFWSCDLKKIQNPPQNFQLKEQGMGKKGAKFEKKKSLSFWSNNKLINDLQNS